MQALASLPCSRATMRGLNQRGAGQPEGVQFHEQHLQALWLAISKCRRDNERLLPPAVLQPKGVDYMDWAGKWRLQVSTVGEASSSKANGTPAWRGAQAPGEAARQPGWSELRFRPPGQGPRALQSMESLDSLGSCSKSAPKALSLHRRQPWPLPSDVQTPRTRGRISARSTCRRKAGRRSARIACPQPAG